MVLHEIESQDQPVDIIIKMGKSCHQPSPIITGTCIYEICIL